MPEQDPSPYHVGEQAVQARVGMREKIEAVGRRVITDHVPAPFRLFWNELPFVIAGTVDDDGQPWASILVGRRGFVRTPDPRSARVDAQPLPTDGRFRARWDAPMALLGIDFSARRRARLSATVSSAHATGFSLQVVQAFGNCPKYIQCREITARVDAAAQRSTAAEALSDDDRDLIARADTFFIASAFESPQAGWSHGADASHRGGRPGFVLAADAHTLLVPDFVGNFAFNTIGNLVRDPRCGLLFIDFECGDMLQLAARADVIWDGDWVDAVRGAQRVLRFHVTHVHRAAAALPLRWRLCGYSPHLDGTGTWTETPWRPKAAVP